MANGRRAGGAQISNREDSTNDQIRNWAGGAARGRSTLPHGPGALRRTLPGMCHGVNVLSPHAHARIKKVDASKARAAPGVLLVLTGADIAHDHLGAVHGRHDAGGSRRAERSPHSSAASAIRQGALRRGPFALIRDGSSVPLPSPIADHRRHLGRAVARWPKRVVRSTCRKIRDKGRLWPSAVISADIAGSEWSVSRRGRAARSSVARRGIRRPRACSGCRLPLMKAGRRALPRLPLPCVE